MQKLGFVVKSKNSKPETGVHAQMRSQMERRPISPSLGWRLVQRLVVSITAHAIPVSAFLVGSANGKPRRTSECEVRAPSPLTLPVGLLRAAQVLSGQPPYRFLLWGSSHCSLPSSRGPGEVWFPLLSPPTHPKSPCASRPLCRWFH